MRISLLLIIASLFLCSFSASSTDYTMIIDDEQEVVYKKERRIFLWDVTISMVGATRNDAYPKGTKRTNPTFDYSKSGFPYYIQENDIFDTTRETLIKLIRQTQKESTEIIVLPYRNGIVGSFVASASEAGKNQLEKQILTWNDLKPGGTFTFTSLKEALNYFTPDRRNHLILLTDGEPTGDEKEKLVNFIHGWVYEKEVHGEGDHFTYVMLTDEAKGIAKDLEKFDGKGDFDITDNIEETFFLSLSRSISIYVRDHFNGKLSNNGTGVMEISYDVTDGLALPEGSSFSFEIEDNEYIDIDSSAIITATDGKFTIPFALKKSSAEEYLGLSDDSVIELTCISKNDGVKIVENDTVSLSLIIKPEPRVKISWSTK